MSHSFLLAFANRGWTTAKGSDCRFKSSLHTCLTMINRRQSHYVSPKRVTSYSNLPPKKHARDFFLANTTRDVNHVNPLPPMLSISARHYVAEPIPKQTYQSQKRSVASATSSKHPSTSASSSSSSSSASSSSSSSTSSEVKDALAKVRNLEKTGTYIRQWPDIYRAPTHFKRAQRALKQVTIDNSITNARNKERKYAAQQLDALMKALTVPITQLITLYQYGFRTLHPFEQTVANLTMTACAKRGHPPITDILTRLQQLRAQTSRLAKDYAKRANNASSALEAKALAVEGMQRLRLLYTDDDASAQDTLEAIRAANLAAEKTTTSTMKRPDARHSRTHAILQQQRETEKEVFQWPSTNEDMSLAAALTDLLVLHQELKRIPILELKRPTVVLVGAPNVGKSSLVRAISSGTPEVNDYPFTTRGVTVGHIYLTATDATPSPTTTHQPITTTGNIHVVRDTPTERVVQDTEQDTFITSPSHEEEFIPAGQKASYQHNPFDLSSSKTQTDHMLFDVTPGHHSLRSKPKKYQVMDTPGLLHRPDEERNEMERLTFASLAQLPTAVLFVIDPTELSGRKLSSLHAQLQVRQYLKQRFPKRPWIDVLSKSDLPLTEAQVEMLREAGVLVPDTSSLDINSSNGDIMPLPKVMRVSVRSGENIEVLRKAVRRMLQDLEVILQEKQFN